MKEAANAYPEVHKFLQYLAVEKNTSVLTVKNYAADIDIFAGFLKTRYHICRIFKNTLSRRL